MGGTDPAAGWPALQPTTEHPDAVAATAERDRHGDSHRHSDSHSHSDSGDESTDPTRRSARQLHPLPPGLVELYGLLAVLVVLVPEWMASGALFGFREVRRGSELPPASGAWKRLPELRLAAMGLGELRQLAQERGLWGYGRDNRSALTARLLRSLQRRP